MFLFFLPQERGHMQREEVNYISGGKQKSAGGIIVGKFFLLNPRMWLSQSC